MDLKIAVLYALPNTSWDLLHETAPTMEELAEALAAALWAAAGAWLDTASPATGAALWAAAGAWLDTASPATRAALWAAAGAWLDTASPATRAVAAAARLSAATGVGTEAGKWAVAPAAATRVVAAVGARGVAVEVKPWDGKKPPTNLQQYNLLHSLTTTSKPCPPYVHKQNVASASPEYLFREHRPHAPGTGDGEQDSAYFYCLAPPIKCITSKGEVRRHRNVPGDGSWHGEKCIPILGLDGSVVGDMRRFSYRGPGRLPTGWIMFEISPKKQEDGVDQMVLCTIHKSKRKHPETSTAASSSPGAETTPSIEPSLGRDESLGSPGDGLQSPAQVVPEMAMPALGIGLTDTTDHVPQATDFNDHGLNRSTAPGTSPELEVHLQHAGTNKELTTTERDEDTHFEWSAHQAMEIPFQYNVLPLEDRVENERENSSSSGVKRKADDDHPEAPPSVRLERADTDPIGAYENNRTPFSQIDRMALGDCNGGDLGASVFDVQPEQLGLPEATDGYSGPGNALDEINTILFSEDLTDAGGDSGGYPDGYWDWAGIVEGNANTQVVLPVGGGQPALPQSAPGAVTEGQGFWTDDMLSQLPPFGNELFPTWDPTDDGRYELLSNVPPPRYDNSMDDFPSFEDFEPLWKMDCSK